MFTYIFFRLLFLAVFVQISSSDGDYPLLTITNQYCINNGSFAVAVIEPIVKEYKSSSFYIPRINSSSSLNLTCNFEDNNQCTTFFANDLWVRQASLENRNKILEDLILDKRWDEFAVIVTEDETEDLKYYKGLSIVNPNSFVIPFSVRASQEAHIFLCEGEYPPETNCYWFLMAGWSGNRTALRKCSKFDKNGIQKTKKDKYPQDKCALQRGNVIEHTKDKPLLSSDIWKHFILKKTGRTFQLLDDKNNLLFWYEDNESDIYNPTHMLIHSKTNSALWKIHNCKYISTTSSATTVSVGPVFEIRRSINYCMSAYILMCKECKLRFYIAEMVSDIVYNSDFYTTKDEKWKEIKFTFISEKSWKNAALYIQKFSKPTHYQFWALDDIRECQETEYKVYEAVNRDSELRCQAMESNPKLYSPLDKAFSVKPDWPITKVHHDCPETTFGERCIPCSWIYGKDEALCGSFKFCEFYSNGMTECSCSAGHYGLLEGNSYKCSRLCGNETFGHNCAKKCGMCQEGCDPRDGHCKNGICFDNFLGLKCDVPDHAVLDVPPTVLKTGIHYCIVRVNNFTTIGLESHPIKYYKIQFKKPLGEWIDVGPVQNFNNSVNISIRNLEADTKYLVRAVLYSYEDDEDNKKNLRDAKEISFRTNCTFISDMDIEIQPTNTSVTLILKRGEKNCRFHNYKVTIDDEDLALNNVDTSKTTKIGLRPSTSYDVIIKYRRHNYRLKKTFTTLDGIPGPVTSIEQKLPLTPNSVHISWKEPVEKNSAVINYTIKYKLTRHLACSQNSGSETKFVIVSGGKTDVIINDLEPYSNFEVEVVPVTSAGEGLSRAINASTSEKVRISKEEVPFSQIHPTANHAKISFDVHCEKIEGPIFVSMYLMCWHPWCSGSKTVIERKSLEYITEKNVKSLEKNVLTLEDLYAFSNYTVTIQYCRNDNECLKTEHNITTDKSVPNAIKDLMATSKGPTEFQLRWSPPYPPTGVLETYNVLLYEYRNGQMDLKDHRSGVIPTRCKLWEEFHCVKITGRFQKNFVYAITVISKNMEVPGYSNDGNFITVTAKETASEAPYNLKTNWTENDKLFLYWTHPNETNGILTNFTIYIRQTHKYNTPNISTSTQVYKLDSENDYRLVYDMEIRDLILPSIIHIVVTPYNSAGPGRSANTTDTESLPIPVDFNVKVTSIGTTMSVNVTTIHDENFKQENLKQTLYILISEESTARNNSVELREFQNSLLTKQEYPKLKSYTIVEEIHEYNTPLHIVIGERAAEQSKRNFPLKSGVSYNMSVIVVNELNDKIRLRWKTVVQMTGEAKDEPTASEGGGGIYALILFIFVIPFLGFIYIRYRKNLTPHSLLENIVEDSKFNSNASTSNQPDIALSSVPSRASYMGEKAVTVAEPILYTDKPKGSVHPRKQTTKHSKLIKVYDFDTYVKTSIENGELKRQHELFPRGITSNANYGSIKENKSKNRYNNVVAYDHNRVKLAKLEGKEYSDYINASYVDGYKTPKAYIATQGPKANTVYDFWRMVWQKNVKHIIMLANVYEGGKRKTEKYWPAMNEELVFNEIKIRFVSSELHVNFEYRSFIVTVDQNQRKVEQLHYTTWPDHGVPLYSQNLVPFLQKILTIPNSTNSPIIVHCSAGVGRTGTIILCDITLRMAAGQGCVDLLAGLEHLRAQRANMVDNIEQYKLAHLVVLECLSGLKTGVPCNKDMEKVIDDLINSNHIKSQRKYIKNTEWQDETMKAITVADGEIPPNYPEKNRFPDIVPENHCRVYITPYPSTDKASSYINAIHVDGFCNPGKFIVTQQPMPNTLGDFWRLVTEQNVTVIVSLNVINLKEKSICQFWPLGGTEIQPVDDITVLNKKTRNLDAYTITTLHIIKNNEQSNKSVIRLVSYNGWIHSDTVPNNLDSFLMFMEESIALTRGSNPAVITCYDGATATGFYIAMSFLIEKMKLEQECDVCQAIRGIRHNRKQFVDSEEQMEYLYRASVKFIKGFQPYSNFDNN